MRRGMHASVVAAICVGMAMVAAPSVAGPPSEYEYQGTELFCSGESEGRMVELGAFFAPTGELESGWGGAYEEGEPGVWVAGADGGRVDGTFEVSYAFLDEAGDPAGIAELSGTTEPAGDPLIVDERWRDGNTQGRSTGTVQDLLVTAEITAASGLVADLVGVDLTCMGSELDLLEWSTNPATRIHRDAYATGGCAIGEDGFLSIEAWGEGAYGFLGIGLDSDPPDLIAEGPLEYSPPDIAGDLMVEPPTDAAEFVQVQLQVGELLERGMWRGKWRNGAIHERYLAYELTGTATIQPSGEQLELTDCMFVEISMMDRYSSRAGQKPGGRPPVNDLPGDAISLTAPDSQRVSTRGAAVLPEAPCQLTFDGDEPEVWDVPFGRTVWYAFEGTGQDVTLDTAGSGFDTVMGVYEAGTLEQVACVDDVAEGEDYSLEAAVTVPTVAGTSYLVQAGGFGWPDEYPGPDWGTLVLSRS